MEELERSRERLENIRSVKPILNGLRTISLGSWQAALKRRSGVRAYSEQLKAMLPALVPHLEAKPTLADRLRELLALSPSPTNRRTASTETLPQPTRCVVLAIGSERGLCGRFNVAVADETERHLRQEAAEGRDVELQALGSRVQRVLDRRGIEAIPAGTLSVTTLPPITLAFDLVSTWMRAFEEYELDLVHLIHNRYRGTGTYEPIATQLIPTQLSTGDAPRTASNSSLEPDGPWPPPIIDTDPVSLYATVIEQWTAAHFYRVLLDSSAAEHSTRFQLMESATQNADQLIEELTLVIQTARRQEITREMTELAAGAGLLQREE